MKANHRARPAFSLFELLMLLALLLLLLALLIPAVAKVREAAARISSANNLKQMALSLHSHNDANGFLPAGVDDNHFSAASKLLPYIEEGNLYTKIDFKKSIDDKANADARKTAVKSFLSPRDSVPAPGEWGATNYLFNDQLFYLNSKESIPRSFPDGQSNTIVIGETLKGDGGTRAVTVQRQYVLLKKADLKGLKDDAGVQPFKDNEHIAGDRCASWMDGRFLQGTFNGRLKLNDERPDVSCGGAGGVSTLRGLDDTIFVGLGDGSAKALNARKLSFITWKNALDPADGNVLGTDW
jgi:hypothetical protein